VSAPRVPPAVRAKYALKWTLAHALHLTGLLALLIRLRLKGRAVVLMYHRVLDDAARAASWSHPAIIVSRETFARQVRLLRRYFTVVEPRDFAAYVCEGRALPGPACVITFDDGWLDTYTEAWPILKAEGLPSVVFLPSQFIGSDRMFWREELGRLLFDAWTRARADAAFATRAAEALRPHGVDGLLREPPDRARAAIIEMTQRQRHQGTAPAPPILDAVRALVAGGPAAASSDAFMSWAQAREMEAGGVTFGAHSVSHRILTSLPDADVAREAAESRRRIAQELRGPIDTFSYPNGNWNDAVAQAVAGAGFQVAYSTDPGPADPGDRRLAVRRINVHEDVTRSLPMFLARVAGVL
jgi:peptidoglycan/xylan/chitin deacetylase (PgdA/CDA1 family)